MEERNIYVGLRTVSSNRARIPYCLGDEAEKELDEGDMEVINAENVRVIVKAGPSTKQVEESVKKDSRYRILSQHQKE